MDITQLTAMLASMGVAPQWALAAGVGIMSLRAVAATISKHVADKKLGRAAPIINALGGNGKWASNKQSKAPKSKLFGALSLVFVWALAMGCATTPGGERVIDPDRCTSIVESVTPLVKGLVCDADFVPLGDTPEEVEKNRARCAIGADLAKLGAKLGCSFADPVPETEES